MKERKDNNRGFSLFSVLIAVSFVAILGMLILYIALANFNMKVTDLKGKDSFYTAERALEEIRTGLQEDVGEAMSTAYTKVLEDYDKDSNTQDATMDAQRQSQFETLFLDELTKRVGNNGSKKQYSLDKLINYVDLLKDSSVFDAKKESLVITNPSDSSEPEMSVIRSTGTSNTKSGILLKNLKVIYVDPKGRAAIIETDIRLGVPAVQFPTPSTLPDLMNMIVVADGGIVCEGNAESESTIQGSIYAGLLPRSKAEETETAQGELSTQSIHVKNNASLKINSGDKVVCAGEINVGNGSSFSSASGVNLWAKGLNVESGKEVSLEGTTYFADDLTISGKNNNVKLAGNYYGFGSEKSALNENCLFKDIYSGTGADLSSAIVINGKNTTLDLSGLQKLMLAGKNYIASSKVTGKQVNKNDIMTGESITVKGTQLAYLLPAELLGAGEQSYQNPMDADTFQEKFAGVSQTGNIAVKMDTPVATWGGKTLRDLGVDLEKPVQTVFYNEPGGANYVYFYLNFTNETNAAAFLQNYLAVNPDAKANMDKYLSFYFGGENSGITVKEVDSYLRYVTGGNVLSYDGKTDTSSLQAATDTDLADDSKLVQEQVGYQNSWYALNRKMISSYDLLNTAVVEGQDGAGNNITHNETESSRSVYDNLVNEKKLVEFVKNNTNDGNLKYEFTADEEDGGLRAIMCHNGENSESSDESYVQGTGKVLEITSELAKKLRLVVCTGDVVIKQNVSFKGIIMTKGTLTLEEGASLESSPMEAAKVFQSQINKTNETNTDVVKAQDFFWDGDKYVLGNAVASGSGNDQNSSDSYSAADYVSYENWKKE